MTDPGTLDQRIVIETPVETPDGAGGVTRGYATAATVWGSIAPVAAAANIEADRAEAAVTHRIVIRRGQTMTTLHRLRNGDRVFRILAFRDSDPRRRFIEIAAQERVG